MENTKKTLKILFIIFLLPFFISSVNASPYLDLAKEAVEDYYVFTKEKDVDSYMALFDQNYLNEMYGANNKVLFEELFTYSDLNDYTINFQQYTEGPESLSLFFHLEADSTLNGEAQKIDQDLLAIFTKTNGEVKLRYIMLQSVYAEMMIAESTFESLLRASLEDEVDLVEEAIEAGLITEEEIEESMAEKESFFKLRHLLIILILGALGYFVYAKKEAIIRNDHGKKITKKFVVVTSKVKPAIKKVVDKTKKGYEEVIAPKTKNFVGKTKKKYDEKLVPKTKELFGKTKKAYNEKLVPKTKKLMANTQKTYKEKIVPKIKDFKAKTKKKINKE